MTTARELATALNLSVSTVGRALADDPRISSRTKQRVVEAATKSGYLVNHAAQMMRGVPSKLVGLVIGDLGNSQYSVGAQSLSRCLEAEGYQLVLSETRDDPASELRHVRQLCSARAAGIVIVPTERPLPETQRLLQTVPYVQWIRRHPALIDQWFCFDNTRAIESATRHLLDLGHSRIGYIGPYEDSFAGRERLAGFLHAQHLTSADPTLTVFGPGGDTRFGQEAAQRLLQLDIPPTALVLGSLQITRGVLDELVGRAIRIPDELSVIGFGDEPGFSWWSPGLTTIAVPNEHIATSCALWLLHKLKRERECSAEENFGSITPGSLVIRGSTALARGS
ncbi:LacI family DNA-binding transcriptional regulator [Sphingomonas sp. 35-24ZXX]|uniref:LacI family DNA-binding transcriptional regulator n=1 Tax=Sphingomonas sp. 35-24ZXX TaxID=1545915 RepID=UPI00053BFE6F|nr:LacI family DNA-binding transcriptional regulator [Sphingomonas sp. 35-24ZXX]